MSRTLHIEYLTFQEGGEQVALAPHLNLCFNSKRKEDSVKSLETGVRMLLDFWREKNELNKKVNSLALNGTATERQRELVEHSVSVPLYVLKKGFSFGQLDIVVEDKTPNGTV